MAEIPMIDDTKKPSSDLVAPMSILSFRHRRHRGSKHRCHSPVSSSAHRIVRKYRRLSKELEYKRLRLIVPAVAKRERASKVRFG